MESTAGSTRSRRLIQLATSLLIAFDWRNSFGDYTAVGFQGDIKNFYSRVEPCGPTTGQ